MPRDITQPPKWAPNAVATDRGWEDPNTGELLVSIRGLKSKIGKTEPEQKEKPKATRKKRTRKTKDAEK